MKRALAFAILFNAAVYGATVAADSDRGAQLFQSLHCVECHAVNGRGGSIGPDLGRRIDRNFTPAALAATMWNHAPTMWSAMAQRNVQAGEVDQQDARDLFAFFYAARFFDKPGDAGRGKALFASKHCAECHGLTEAKLPAAKPVAQWESLGHPIVLIDRMWDHGATMRQQFAARNIPWPELSSQDLIDMLVYLRNLPAARGLPARFAINAGDEGRALFESKGCVKCHTGKLALEPRLKNKTLTDIAAAMWNHEPRMASPAPELTVEEMRQVVSYLWARQFFEDAGNPILGERVFTAKHCAGCHNNASSGAPRLPGTGGPFSAATMIAALWHHGPAMLARMQHENIAWPRFNVGDMSNLIAYLNAKDGTKQ